MRRRLRSRSEVVDRARWSFFFCFFSIASFRPKKRTQAADESSFSLLSAQCDSVFRDLLSERSRKTKRRAQGGREREQQERLPPPSPQSTNGIHRLRPFRGRPPSLATLLSSPNTTPPPAHLVGHDVFGAERLAGLLEAGLGAGVGVVAHCLVLIEELFFCFCCCAALLLLSTARRRGDEKMRERERERDMQRGRKR